jgi:hypothetical protein
MDENQEYIQEIKETRNHNATVLDTTLLKYSSVACALLFYSYDKFCVDHIKVYYLISLVLVSVSVATQLLALKFSVYYQELCILYFETSDIDDKMKLFRKYDIAYHCDKISNLVSFISFLLSIALITFMFCIK